VPFCHWHRQVLPLCHAVTVKDSPVPVPALPRCANEGGKTGARQKLGEVRRQTSTLSFNSTSRDASRGPLWNANGNVDENFRNLPVCWCGNTRGRW